MKMAILSDIHASEYPVAIPTRKGEWGLHLVRRALARITRWIKPDVILVLGDVNNDGNSGNIHHLDAIRDELDATGIPFISVPGNHDQQPADHYRHMPDHRPYRDVAGVRFAVFCDPEAPGYCATRLPAQMDAMRCLRHDGFSGPIAMLQHVPVLPERGHFNPYVYTNLPEVLACMREMRIGLALGGHYHPGVMPMTMEGMVFAAAPALCEMPFSFLELDWDGTSASCRRHTLAMPTEFGLVDTHVHTHFAYCNENMEPARMAELSSMMGLSGFVFAEHSSHLLFSCDTIRTGYEHGVAARVPAHCRMDAYFETIRPLCAPNIVPGLEMDIDFSGQPFIRPEDLSRIRFALAAVHQIPNPDYAKTNPAAFAEDVYHLSEAACRSGRFQALAHPLRTFDWRKAPIPAGFIPRVVKLLKETGVAAELNFHKTHPGKEFVAACLDAGVKFTFGSDAHNMIEVGEFYPQLELLRELGVSDPRPHLLPILS